MMELYEYGEQLYEALRLVEQDTLTAVLSILDHAHRRQRTLFTFGNGGSAATASHFAGDIAKNTQRPDRPPFRAICLNDNITSMLAYANDEGYGSIFARPLAGLVEYGDIVVGISTSGESENVVRGLETAVKLGAVTIGLTDGEGGRVGQIARYHIAVPGECIEIVEDGHLAVCHWLVKRLKK